MQQVITSSRLAFAVAIAAIAAVLTLILAPLTAHADNTVTLHPQMSATSSEGNHNQTIGSATSTSATVTEDGKLGALPTPTAPDGWTFKGWYTGEVQAQWWNDSKYLKSDGTEDSGKLTKASVPQGFQGLTNVRDGNEFDENDFWSYLVGTSGTKVSEGDAVSAGTTLYAAYVPKSVHVFFHWNGWENKWGALDVTRDYGTSTTHVVMATTWGDHRFTEWRTASRVNSGTEFDCMEPVKAEETNVYAHYTGMADDPEAQHNSMIAAWNIKVSPANATIAPQGGKVTLTAKLSMMSSTDVPKNTDWKNVKWKVVEGKDLVTLSPDNGSSCTVTAQGSKTGTAKVQASFLDEKAKTIQSTATITVEAHVHTFGKETVLVTPTCQRAGYGNKTCSTCGETVRVDYPKVDHTYKTEVKEATCTEPGYEKTVCTVCRYVKQTKDIAATGHKNTTERVQSCTGEVVINTCSICGHSEQTQGTGQGQHQWEKDYTIDKPATCGHAGSKSIHCAKCSVTKESTEIPKTDNHAWGGWHTTKPATVDAKGEQERSCSICGKTETQELPALVADQTPTDPEDPEEPAQPEDPPAADEPDTPDTPDTPDDPDQPVKTGPTSAVRIYNRYSHEHLFVAPQEASVLAAKGWTVESKATTPAVSSTPVYRLYNPNSQEHLYTTDRNEYDVLDAGGWDGEGVQFYSDDNKAVKVFRLYSGQDGPASHLFTDDMNEYATLLAQGWTDEGLAWYYEAS